MPEPAVLKIGFKGPSGEDEITTGQLMEDLAEAGYNPQNISPDGMTVTLVDAQGPYEAPIGEIMHGLGHQVTNLMPENMGSDNVDPGLRFAVENLGDDDDRRTFLQAKLDRMYGGNTAPRVSGQGSDWFYFDPNTGYQALTNTPGLDAADIGEIGTVLPKLGAETLGFSAGGPAGGAAANFAANSALRTVAGAKEGKGMESLMNFLSMVGPAGSVLAPEASKRIDELQDPDFQAAMPSQEQFKASAEEAGISGLFGLGAKAGGVLLPKVANVIKSGPLSTAGEAAGGLAEGAGGLVKGGIDIAKSSPTAEELLIKYNPMNPLSNATFMSSLMRAPRGAVTGAAEGIGALGKNETFAKMFGQNASKGLANFSEELMARAPGAELTATDVLKNVGQKAGNRLRSANSADAWESVLAGEAPKVTFKETTAAALPRAGESLGRVLHGAGELGKAGENVLGGISSMAASGIRSTGMGLQGAGRAARTAFGATKGIEPYMYYGLGRGGLENMRPKADYRSEEQIIFDRWRKRRQRDNMGLDFAQNR